MPPPGLGYGGSAFGGGSFGGSSFESSSSSSVVDAVLSDNLDVSDGILSGIITPPTFKAGAVSAYKVEVIFSIDMTIDAAFISPGSYIITEIEGAIPIQVLSVTPSGTHRAVLSLDMQLSSKDFYSIVLGSGLVSFLGVPIIFNTGIFQWADMPSPLVISIEDFSGEVSGGLLGEPDGLVFFSPAYNAVSNPSFIEVQSVSACTKAYDEYHLPAPPDPIPLMTFGGPVPSLIGAGTVLWAPADRLGQARLDLFFKHSEILGTLSDSPIGELSETIDITKASFLNDSRWKMFPAIGFLPFMTASNLSAIGPGPTTPVTFSALNIIVQDTIAVTDVSTTSIDLFLNESIDVSDATFSNMQFNRASNDTADISDSVSLSSQYSLSPSDSVSMSDSVSGALTIDVTLSDAITASVTVIAHSSSYTPLTILGSTVKQWVRGDLGVTGTSSVTAWADQSGNAHNYAEATLTPSLEATGFNGKPSILFDGINDRLVNSTLAATLPGGTDVPISIYIAGQFVTNVAATPIIYGIGRTGATNPAFDLFYNNTGAVWGCNKRDNAGLLVGVSGGTRDTNRHIFEIHQTGTTVDLVVDGVYVVTAGAQDVGATTLTTMTLGCLFLNATYQLFANCRIAEVVVCNANPTLDQKSLMRSYLSDRYS